MLICIQLWLTKPELGLPKALLSKLEYENKLIKY